jgi:L-alanine-DL-glutamate epimerase-like enolase superfamily enzyme
MRDRLSCYVSGPFLKPRAEPYAHYRDDIDGYLAQGFRNIKIRAGIDARADAALVADVRGGIGDDIGLWSI